MKKIARPRQLTLLKYKRISRRRIVDCPRLMDTTEDTPEASGNAAAPSLRELTSFVLDERRNKQRARARNFLWWLQAGSPYRH